MLPPLQRLVSTGYQKQLARLAKAQNQGNSPTWRAQRQALAGDFKGEQEPCLATEAAADLVASPFARYRHSQKLVVACDLTRRALFLRLNQEVNLASYRSQVSYVVP